MNSEPVREGWVFFSDLFVKCFQQDTDLKALGYERDDKNGGWWAKEEDVYRAKTYVEPEDRISRHGLATNVKRKSDASTTDDSDEE